MGDLLSSVERGPKGLFGHGDGERRRRVAEANARGERSGLLVHSKRNQCNGQLNLERHAKADDRGSGRLQRCSRALRLWATQGSDSEFQFRERDRARQRVFYSHFDQRIRRGRRQFPLHGHCNGWIIFAECERWADGEIARTLVQVRSTVWIRRKVKNPTSREEREKWGLRDGVGEEFDEIVDNR